ncbi:MAG TPA: class I SAM-dependent methyltransferase [Kofleriaceae bacterium]|nr:class I SAM-dependent methyltransferase [Kofleriaceae bacterium]
MQTRLLIALALVACAHPAAKEPSMFAQADSYEQFMGRWSRLLAPPFVAFAGIHDGAAVLDVGSGTGVLSFAVRAADPSGTIEGIDLSPEYVAYASKQHPEAHTHFAVGDAQKLAFAPATFDAALSLLVLNFVPDPGLAVAEMKRVTKPGGTLAAAVWDYGGDMEMLRIFADEASALDPNFVTDERKMPLGKPGALGALFRAGGLEHVEEAPVDITLHFASFDDYWRPFLLGTGPAGAYVAKLSPERRDALAARLRKRFVGDTDHAFDLKGRAWAVKGSVP